MTTPKIHRTDGVDGGDTLIIESGGKILDRQSQGGSQAALLFHHDVAIAHSSLATYSVPLTIADRAQIIDVSVLKTVAGGSASTSSPTITLKTSTGGAITNAIAGIAVVDKTVTRVATIDDDLAEVTGTINIVKNGAGLVLGASVAKSHDCLVRITCVKRSG